MIVSILGHGIVGKGVWDMLQGRSEFTVRNVLVKKGEKTEPFMTESFDDVEKDDSELVIECMGGVDPAFDFASRSIRAGKSFISSNKALVAAHGIELAAMAREKGVSFLFSAACGGAIPILQNLCLARKSDSIIWAGGILNGTTNYILDSMDRRGLSFADALSEARTLGYAEADPTADISGMDTMRKIILISMVAYDVLPNSDYNLEGIQSVSAGDFETAKELGCTIRLLGRCGLSQSGRLYAYVQPALCPASDLYAGVRSNTNLARYQGKNSGLMGFSGQGAGRYPTASAILRDVWSVLSGQKQMLDRKCLVGFAYNDSTECSSSYFVRLASDQVPQLEAKVGLEKTVKEAGGISFAITKKTSVKKMHDAVSELRRGGRDIFFAEMREEA
ncbi:MAG: homoserine dehydrogenase [Spirochaetales bacterium]|nr:homoserine dehydrogenase [Spirochaetales bacterium]